MSHWRVKLELECDTQVKRDAVVSACDSARVGKQIFDAPYTSSSRRENGRFAAVRDARYRNETDARAVYSAVKTTLQAQRNGMNAKISIHLCTHDDAVVIPCNQSQYEEFVI